MKVDPTNPLGSDVSDLPPDGGALDTPAPDGGVVDPNTPPPGVVAEPTDPSERSQLGRRVKGLEELVETKFTDLASKLDLALSRVGTPPAPAPHYPQSPPDDEEMPEYITTPEDFRKFQRIEAQREARAGAAYSGAYVQSVYGLNHIDPTHHAEIVAELLQVNPQRYMKHTMDPRRDAELNYHMARANVLSKKLVAPPSTPPPSVRGGGNPPAGVTVTGRQAAPPQNPIALDDYSRKFLRAIGANEADDWVQESVSKAK